MRLFSVLVCFLFSLTLLAQSPVEELSGVKSVYVMKMGNGFDQYLISRLAASGPFRVVTHPQEADAVFTDRVGVSLENWLDELATSEKPEKDEKKDEKREEKKEEDANMVGSASYDARSASVNPESSFSRGRGNYYLVNPKTKTVLWSIFLPPKSTTPKDLNATAQKVVKELRSHLKELGKQ